MDAVCSAAQQHAAERNPQYNHSPPSSSLPPTLLPFLQCLADEIINASKGSSNSYAIKKKDEVERVAKANR